MLRNANGLVGWVKGGKDQRLLNVVVLVLAGGTSAAAVGLCWVV